MNVSNQIRMIDSRTRESAEAVGIHDSLVDDGQVRANILHAHSGGSDLPYLRLEVSTIDYFPVIEEGRIVDQVPNISTRKISIIRPGIIRRVNGRINGNFAVRGLLGSRNERDRTHRKRALSNYEKITIFFRRDMSQMDFTLERDYQISQIFQKATVYLILGVIYIKVPIIPLGIAAYHTFTVLSCGRANPNEEAIDEEASSGSAITDMIGRFFPLYS